MASTGLVPPALRRKRTRQRLRTLGFLSPWLVGFSVFFGYPLIATVYFSFVHYNQIKPPEFVGLRNWKYVLTQMPLFGPALWNTLWLVVVMVALRVVFGLGIGILVTKIKSGPGLFRTAFYLPYLAPPVAATVAFVFLLNPGTGPVNEILGAVGLPAPSWFNDPGWAKPSLVLLSLWGIGDLMVIFMAALLDVPREQYEAAELDEIRRLGEVPLRHLAVPHPDRDVRGGHRSRPDHAVLHPGAGRRKARLRRLHRPRHGHPARLPGPLHPHRPAARLLPGLPELQHRRGVCALPRAVRPRHGRHHPAAAQARPACSRRRTDPR